jgi:hypothetical protein
MSTPRAPKQGRSFQQPRQHPIFDLCFLFTQAFSGTPQPRRVLQFTQEQKSGRLATKSGLLRFSALAGATSIRLQVSPSPSRLEESALTLACWYDCITQLPRDALLTVLNSMSNNSVRYLLQSRPGQQALSSSRPGQSTS